ncbi:MAG: dNTP triphosphohydrolase [Candidatus Peregrinibacteria bacterium]
MFSREDQQRREAEMLPAYALKNAFSKGRKYPEAHHAFRLDFARDRDRIVHTKAFRRLKGKTQVFVAHHGDHFRSRLTHSLEVAQVARVMARALGANEDMVETVALAHDLGHTPFGHAGQDALNALLKPFGESFEHNAQSRRIVEVLEIHHPHPYGLNLCEETLECLCKHPTVQERERYNLPQQNFLEGQIVDIADMIAYLAHDLEDGLCAGLLLEEQVQNLPLVRRMGNTGFSLSALVNMLVEDVVLCSAHHLQVLLPQNPEDIRRSDVAVARFSDPFLVEVQGLKRFLYDAMYQHPTVTAQIDFGVRVIETLFDYYIKHPQDLPEDEQRAEDPVFIRVKDFIAGMTDVFAIEQRKKILGKGI